MMRLTASGEEFGDEAMDDDDECKAVKRPSRSGAGSNPFVSLE